MGRDWIKCGLAASHSDWLLCYLSRNDDDDNDDDQQNFYVQPSSCDHYWIGLIPFSSSLLPVTIRCLVASFFSCLNSLVPENTETLSSSNLMNGGRVPHRRTQHCAPLVNGTTGRCLVATAVNRGCSFEECYFTGGSSCLKTPWIQTATTFRSEAKEIVEAFSYVRSSPGIRNGTTVRLIYLRGMIQSDVI